MNEKFVKCSFYDDKFGYGICSGTYECEKCSCKGNALRCDFYMDRREEAKKEVLQKSLPYDRLFKMFDSLVEYEYQETTAADTANLLRAVCEITDDEIDVLDLDWLFKEGTESIFEEVQNKAKKELEEYKSSLSSRSAGEVYEEWMKTAFMESMYNAIRYSPEDNFYNGALEWLLKKENMLEDLYSLWYDTDSPVNFDSDMLIESINCWYSEYLNTEGE